MSGPANSLHKTSAFSFTFIAILILACVAHSATAQTERVRGFFCEAKSDSVAFLTYQAQGANEEIAANSVNKSIAKFSCAYYLPANAVYTGDHTVFDHGMVYKLQSYVFLPEKIERWTGSVLGSLQPSSHDKQDV
ncbi:MAG: hypothetical protein WDN31_22775 [Hyphomicrobium sp.]